MRILALLATVAPLLAGTAASASSFTFTTLDNAADPTFNQLLGINDSGVISGYFGSGAPGHPNQGYTIAAPYTSFVNANLPGSVQTQATGISSTGFVTGFWSDTNTGADANFGFVRMPTMKGFVYYSVNNPAVSSTPLVNQVLGINAGKIAVGFYNDSTGASHGYTYTVPSGTFKAVTIPGASSSAATGINNNNLICGFAVEGGVTEGYLKALRGGAPTLFEVPHSTTTQFLGVNNAGMAVGFYLDANSIPHGIIYNPTSGTWQAVNEPGGVGGTVLNGINNKNQAVGFYTDAAGNTHGMIVNITP